MCVCARSRGDHPSRDSYLSVLPQGTVCVQYLHVCVCVCARSRGDHTSADSYLTVLPQGTEFVVFSIDGSFAASVSIMGSDPKVRAGAVDVVR